jgi:hypothetical protein
MLPGYRLLRPGARKGCRCTGYLRPFWMAGLLFGCLKLDLLRGNSAQVVHTFQVVDVEYPVQVVYLVL